MNRREYLKTLMLATIGSNLVVSTGCSTIHDPNNASSRINWTKLPSEYYYGRTDVEKAHDINLLSQTFFSNHELVTLATLCDIILPEENLSGGALDAGVPDFIEFISKEREYLKIPLRGGIMWLDSYAIEQHGADFLNINESSRLNICDEIAYPENQVTHMQPGIHFFSLVRDLTMTGYYTTELGFKELGYQGNSPNIWDGVPERVLQRHGKQYDSNWLSKCIDQSTREVPAEWDDDMNLIS